MCNKEQPAALLIIIMAMQTLQAARAITINIQKNAWVQKQA